MTPSDTYGDAINAALRASYGYTKPFVIDTSRQRQRQRRCAAGQPSSVTQRTSRGIG